MLVIIYFVRLHQKRHGGLEAVSSVLYTQSNCRYR